MYMEPCPFCGCTDVEVENEDGSFWYVFCNRCLCEGPNVLSESAAIQEWNDRAKFISLPSKDSLAGIELANNLERLFKLVEKLQKSVSQYEDEELKENES